MADVGCLHRFMGANLITNKWTNSRKGGHTNCHNNLKTAFFGNMPTSAAALYGDLVYPPYFAEMPLAESSMFAGQLPHHQFFDTVCQVDETTAQDDSGCDSLDSPTSADCSSSPSSSSMFNYSVASEDMMTCLPCYALPYPIRPVVYYPVIPAQPNFSYQPMNRRQTQENNYSNIPPRFRNNPAAKNFWKRQQTKKRNQQKLNDVDEEAVEFNYANYLAAQMNSLNSIAGESIADNLTSSASSTEEMLTTKRRKKRRSNENCLKISNTATQPKKKNSTSSSSSLDFEKQNATSQCICNKCRLELQQPPQPAIMYVPYDVSGYRYFLPAMYVQPKKVVPPPIATSTSSIPPSFCYISISRANNDELQTKDGCNNNNTVYRRSTTDIVKGDGHSSVDKKTFDKHNRTLNGNFPCITVHLPPNCRIISDDGSVQLSSNSYASLAGDNESESSCMSDDESLSATGSDCEMHDSSFSDGISVESFDSFESCKNGNYFYGPTVAASPPPQRQWISIERPQFDNPAATFTVFCYNVLCDKYASQNLYSYCPSWALSWDYRKKAIIEEIKSGDADIVTLQEIETEQYLTLFQPELTELGYMSIFSPKSRAKTMMEDERRKVDGCAIFWKAQKFSLEKEQLIEFTHLAIAKAEGSEQMLNRVMTRDNIALVAVLRVKEAIYGDNPPADPQLSVVDEPLVVCTAHIHWDPEFCDVKLVQAMMLVQELSGIIEDTAENWSGDRIGGRIVSRGNQYKRDEVPFLICGDLNSLPQSGVYEFVSKGRIAANHLDFKEFRGDPVLQKVSNGLLDKDYFSHSLRVESAYNQEIMPFTNFTYDFKGMIDYVFASENCFTKLGILGPLDLQWFQENKIIGCPHPHVPSDHIPLLVQYELLPKAQRQLKSSTVTNSDFSNNSITTGLSNNGSHSTQDEQQHFSDYLSRR